MLSEIFSSIHRAELKTDNDLFHRLNFFSNSLEKSKWDPTWSPLECSAEATQMVWGKPALSFMWLVTFVPYICLLHSGLRM